jgi:hypothetical protein
LPSHVVAGVNVLPSLLQLATTQMWLDPTLRQAPLPSHVPSLPHSLVAVSSTHALCATLPLNTGVQRPSELPVRAFEQALHPVQAVAQHTPSMQ